MVPDGVRTLVVPVFVVGLTAVAYAGYVARRRRTGIDGGSLSRA